MTLSSRMLAAVAAILTFYNTAYSMGGPQDIVPRPQEYSILPGEYSIPEDGVVLSIRLGNVPGLPDGLEEWCREGAYRLEVRRNKVTIRAFSETGVFYARQSLGQMCKDSRSIACCTVTDYPRFRWRGLMFDISRFYLPAEFLRRQIDVMAQLKMNVMHVHLTDDGGWRLEMPSLPELTEKTAFRLGSSWKEWGAQGHRYASREDRLASGGYLSGEEMRRLVQYAAERHIVIIPEIDVPGHSDAALATYPWLRCRNSDGSPRMDTHELCIGNPQTYEFLYKAFDDIFDMFPSEYIHIGGDEASTSAWAECPECKALMEREGMSGVSEIQSYLVAKVAEHITAKGRKVIGWHDPLNGRIPDGMSLMAWFGGPRPGEEIARHGIDVVMSPNTLCYLDYCQDAPVKEPHPMGSYMPIDSVYSYNPTALLDKDAASRVLGVQGNLWTEHIDSEQEAEYMLYPRAIAIAEVGWSSPDRNTQEFRERASAFCKEYLSGYDYFDLDDEVGERSAFFHNAEHLATGAAVLYNSPCAERFPGSGATVLTDGRLGGWSFEGDRWNGFNTDMDVTLDLGEKRHITSVEATFMGNKSVWIATPQSLEVLVSDDGVTFRQAGRTLGEVNEEVSSMVYLPIRVYMDEDARYVRVIAHKKTSPTAVWLFTDEIIVN